MEENIIKRDSIYCERKTRISDLKHIGSFNWVEYEEGPRILVPGKPKVYKHTNRSTQLKNDGNMEFIDENHYRQPNFPTETIFRSVKLCTPEFSFVNVDFVTDRNNLRKLIRFLDPNSKKIEKFRILAVRIGKTVILTREEPNDIGDAIGYGHNFERWITTNTVDGSFRRIISYKLDTLSLVVRLEVDAVENYDVDDITEKMSSLTINESWNSISGSEIEYRSCGVHTNLAYIELKTKSSRFAHEFDWKEAYMQMILGGISKVVIGLHNRGYITPSNIKIYNEPQIKKNCHPFDETLILGKLKVLLERIKIFLLKYDEKEVFEIKFDPIDGFLTLKKSDKSIISPTFELE